MAACFIKVSNTRKQEQESISKTEPLVSHNLILEVASVTSTYILFIINKLSGSVNILGEGGSVRE
jgi:hypothetical protein